MSDSGYYSDNDTYRGWFIGSDPGDPRNFVLPFVPLIHKPNLLRCPYRKITHTTESHQTHPLFKCLLGDSSVQKPCAEMHQKLNAMRASKTQRRLRAELHSQYNEFVPKTPKRKQSRVKQRSHVMHMAMDDADVILSTD